MTKMDIHPGWVPGISVKHCMLYKNLVSHGRQCSGVVFPLGSHGHLLM